MIDMKNKQEHAMPPTASIQPPRPIDQTLKLLDPAFQRELVALINRHNLEAGSNTPDYVIAAYLASCLSAYDRAAYMAWCHSTSQGFN